MLAITFLLSTGQYLLRQQDKAAGSSTYEEALQLASSPKQNAPQPTFATQPPAPAGEPRWVPAAPEEEDPHISALEAMDLEALREVNPDVVGWILIPDTQINYPLMQGQDNDYYLNRTWDGKSNAIGSIFLEHLNLPDLTDPNTIVYGHNMNDGSMFAEIKQYRDQEYAQQHPYVYILNDAGAFRYEIFAAYEADVESSTTGSASTRARPVSIFWKKHRRILISACRSNLR